MRIKRVHIEHFRSIQSLDFEPDRFCVLIGENNSGKSNILRALTLALGDTWPTERSFSEEASMGRVCSLRNAKDLAGRAARSPASVATERRCFAISADQGSDTRNWCPGRRWRARQDSNLRPSA